MCGWKYQQCDGPYGSEGLFGLRPSWTTSPITLRGRESPSVFRESLVQTQPSNTLENPPFLTQCLSLNLKEEEGLKKPYLVVYNQ